MGADQEEGSGVGVDRQRHAGRVPGRPAPAARLWIAQQLHEQAAAQQGPEQKAGVATGILGEPDVVIREREQGGGHQRLASSRHLRRKPVKGGQAGHTEQRGRQPQCPRALAEDRHGKPRQQRVQHVLVLAVEGGHDLAER